MRVREREREREEIGACVYLDFDNNLAEFAIHIFLQLLHILVTHERELKGASHFTEKALHVIIGYCFFFSFLFLVLNALNRDMKKIIIKNS